MENVAEGPTSLKIRTTEILVGQTFRETDRRGDGRSYKVVAIFKAGEHHLKRATAVCVGRNKLTVVALDRLLSSRFEFVPQEGDVVDAEVDA